MPWGPFASHEMYLKTQKSYPVFKFNISFLPPICITPEFSDNLIADCWLLASGFVLNVETSPPYAPVTYNVVAVRTPYGLRSTVVDVISLKVYGLAGCGISG